MNVLVTAIGSMSAGQTIRSLRQLPDVARVVGVNTNPAADVPLSRQVDVFAQVPMAHHAGYISALVDVCRDQHIDRLIPLTDPEVDALSEHRDTFTALGVHVGVSPTPVIRVCRDKLAICDLFESSDVVTVIPTLTPGDERRYDLPLPWIVKPRRGRSSIGVRIITALPAADDDLAIPADAIIQPQIAGEIVTVDIVRDAAGHTVAIPRIEHVRTHNGAGLVVGILADDALMEQARVVADSLGVIGAVNVEFIRRDGVNYLMDVNPRFSAGIAFSVMAGYDIVGNHLRACDGLAIEPQPALRARRFAKIYTEVELD